MLRWGSPIAIGLLTFDRWLFRAKRTYASSDPRLADMLSVTAGLKYQYKTSATGSIDFRLAYIHRQYGSAVVGDDGTLFLTVDLGKGFD